MKKLFGLLFVLVVGLCIAGTVSAYTIAWDYTNPTVDEGNRADGFKLYATTDKGTWPTEPIATYNGDVTSGDLPFHTQDNERVYYRLTAFNGEGESEPSPMISFYWKTADGTTGTGWSGPQAPGGLKIVDCTKTPNDGACN